MDPAEERQHALERLHILDAMTTAIERRGELLRIVEECKSEDDARSRLQSEWGMAEDQARCVLDLQVRRFAERERGRIVEEQDWTRQRIAELSG